MNNYFANISDLLEIPESIFSLTIKGWFDRSNIIYRKNRNIDNIFVQVKGKNQEQVIARSYILQKLNKVRNGGGVRIVHFKKKEELKNKLITV
jgi:hypothetical protein